MESTTLCPFCSEKIPAGTERCPHCGEVLGAKPMRQATGWGSKHQPMSVAVFGWLNIVFGAMGILGSAMMVGMFIFIGSNNLFVNQAMGEPGSALRTLQLFNVVSGAVTSVLYLVSGYGLLRLERYGRKLALGTAIYMIVISIVMPLFSIPLALQTSPAGQEAILIGTAAFTLFISLIYPVLTLFFLTRPHVGAALDHHAAKASA